MSLRFRGRWESAGGRITQGIGITALAGLVTLASTITSLYWFIAVLALAYGVGAALILLPGMFMSWGCLPGSKGLATGLVLLLFAAGTALFSLGFTFYVNPDNATPSERIDVHGRSQYLFRSEVADRVPAAFQWSAAISVALGALSLVLIRDYSQPLAGRCPSDSLEAILSDGARNCPSLRAAAGTTSFWSLHLFITFAPVFTQLMNAQFKNYGELYHSDDHYLSGVGSVAQLANGVARFAVCWLTDFFPYRVLMTVSAGVLGGLALTVQYVVGWDLAYGLWVSLTMVCGGCIFSPTSLICREIFGTKIGSQVFSLLSIGPTCLNFALVLFVLYVIQVTARQPYGYEIGFWVCGGITLGAALVISRLRVKYDWGGKQPTKGLSK